MHVERMEEDDMQVVCTIVTRTVGYELRSTTRGTRSSQRHHRCFDPAPLEGSDRAWTTVMDRRVVEAWWI